MTLHVRAPASTANLGPGFDCAAAALDLWNELELEPNGTVATVDVEGEGAEELPRDAQHLSLRAFALFASPDRYRFRFVNRIPLERGLGSSAAAVALGLVAGASVANRELGLDELLAAGESLEGHRDNLAAALHGGVTVAWRRAGTANARRLADGLPLRPVLVVPRERTSTRRSRAALPATVTHEDAAATAAAAALLGAGIVQGDADLLGSAFQDRLHEPYRLASAPLLARLRDRPPAKSVGVTLSGSGPSVVVWARPADVDGVVAELERNVPDDTTVLPLRVAQRGAGVE